MNILDVLLRCLLLATLCQLVEAGRPGEQAGRFLLSGGELHPGSGTALHLLHTEVIQASRGRGTIAGHVHVSSFALQGKHPPNIRLD